MGLYGRTRHDGTSCPAIVHFTVSRRAGMAAGYRRLVLLSADYKDVVKEQEWRMLDLRRYWIP
ncbi:MAG: hypothetical protein K2N95_08040 [Lachnospiraceae bacterium]|nr:hypothetical protein [Lachnospiraceae bacterium]